MKSLNECIDEINSIIYEHEHENESDFNRLSVSVTKYIDKCITVFPESYDLWILRGDSIQLLEDNTDYPLEDALQSYIIASMIDTMKYQAFEEIGYYYDCYLDNNILAKYNFNKSIELGGGIDSYIGLSRVLAQLGNHQEAIVLLQKSGYLETSDSIIDMYNEIKEQIQPPINSIQKGLGGKTKNNDLSLNSLKELLNSADRSILNYAVDRLLSDTSLLAKNILSNTLQDNSTNYTIKAHILNNIGKTHDIFYIPVIIKLLDCKDPLIVQCSAETLGILKSGNAVPKLIDILKTHSDHLIIYKTIQALYNIGTQLAIKEIIHSLSDKNIQTRIIVSRYLGSTSLDDAIPYLIKSSENDINHLVRRFSAISLSQISIEKSINTLIKLLCNDDNEWVRRNAAVILGKQRPITSLEAIVKAITDDNWIVRLQAVSIIGEIGSNKEISILNKIIDNDPFDTIKRESVAAIQKIKEKDKIK